MFSKRNILIITLIILTSHLNAQVIKNGRINSSIVTIFERFMHLYTPEERKLVTHLNPYNLTQSISDLNKLGQKYFLRPASLSRLEPKKLEEHYVATFFNNQDIDIKKECQTFFDLFKEAGYMDPVYNSVNNPSAILIFGSTVMNMWNRISFFNSMINENRFSIDRHNSAIIVCLGERTLETYEKTDLEKLSTQSKTTCPSYDDERDAGKYITELFPFCSNIDKDSLQFAIAPKKPNTPRATTADTIEAWLTLCPNPSGTILIVSNNPYVEYQTETTILALAQKHLYPQKNLCIVGCGYGSTLTSETFQVKDLGIYLDNIARTLYTLNKLYSIIPAEENLFLKTLYDIRLRCLPVFNFFTKMF